MSLTRTTCPSCGAGLKSAAGFNPGQSVRCPKCSTAFAVPAAPAFETVDDDEPAPPKKKGQARAAAKPTDDDDRPRRRPRDDDEDDDDDDDRPRKKGKKKGGYKNSPVRFAILGVLLVVLGVLAFLLYQKKQREAEDAQAPPPAPTDGGDERPVGRPGPGPAGGDLPQRPGFGNTGVGRPQAAAAEVSLKQIMLAMHNHSDATGAMPAAAITAGPGGKALLSWRVAILPFIEQDALHKQFKLDEPWDGPNNKKLLAQMPRTYQGTLPGNDGKTAFKVFVGGGAAFDLRRGPALRGIADGNSNTIAVVESGPAVEWTKPEDIPFDGKTLPPLAPPNGGDILLVGMMDGSTRRLSVTANSPEMLVWAITANGAEPVELK